MQAQIIKTVYVEAARRIHNPDDKTECYTGNSYRIDIIAEGPIDQQIGWVIDYGDIKKFFEPVRQQLDHCCLSDIPALAADCSTEAIARWIADQLQPHPAWFVGVRVSLPAPDALLLRTLPPEPALSLPERLAFSFSAAQSLPQLPAGHPCRALHGHTYQIEIAPADMPGIESAAARIFARLDNTYINRIQGLEQATAERIAAWIWQRLKEERLTPQLVAVQETPSNRCHYHGE